MKKRMILIFILFVLVLAGIFLVNVCDEYSGWGATQEYCYCNGYEYILYDEADIDGDKKSYCIGIREDFDCFKYVDGRKASCK